MVYFIGNVLSPTETQPEQNDPTFAFTHQESKSLSLKGIPIRMEHNDKMEVGTVRSSWTAKNGTKWIVGKLNDSGLQSVFAKHAIASDKPYYTGLSLQHTHTQFANGTTSKAPVEVSLCCDPRRADCRIVFVESKDKRSRKTTYKTAHTASKMTDTIQPTIIADETAAPIVTEMVEPAAPAVDKSPSAKEMMEIIIKQQKELEQNEQQQVEYVAYKASVSKEKEERLNQIRSKNEALAKALVETWSKELNQDDLNDQSRHNIMELAKKYPAETQDFFRVAHHASKKFAQRDQARLQELEANKDVELKKSFNQVMSKQVHVASSKSSNQVEKAPTDHFMKALNKYRVEGSGRDLMERVLEIQQPVKRRKMY
mgnify:CR=1 FL=1|tara:strand:- start:158 stop:1267 length:1110 start_codon:yes stop_codon:yes gene_type:complete